MKYVLTNETKQVLGRTVHRIIALKDFGSVKKGDIGGYIEKEENLSQTDNAWVSGNAVVFENARVYGNAKICGNSMVRCIAMVYDNAIVRGHAKVSGYSKVFGNAVVYDYAEIFDYSRIYDSAKVHKSAIVYGGAEICGNAEVCDDSDYTTFKNTWSSGQWFTYTSSNKMWKVDCFYGTGEELIKKAYADSDLDGKCYEAIVKATENIEYAKQKMKE